MSRVTNVVVAHSCAEDEMAVARMLNDAVAPHHQGARWFREANCCQQALLNALAVGDKHPEIELHVAAINYAGEALNALVAAFMAYRWAEPTEAALIVAPQEGDWLVYRPVAPAIKAAEVVAMMAALLRQAEREIVPRDPRWDGWGEAVKRALAYANEVMGRPT